MKRKDMEKIIIDLYDRVEHIMFGDSVVRKTAKTKADLKDSILYEFSKALDKLEK